MPSDAGYQELIRFELDVDNFAADWGHCGLISSHLASLVSHKRRDPHYYANLLSSALNELFEVAFRVHGPEGAIGCAILHDGPADRIVMDIPCDARSLRFYEEAITLSRSADVAALYVGCLLDERNFDPRTGLFELAVDYQARLAIENATSGALRLTVDLTLEDFQS